MEGGNYSVKLLKETSDTEDLFEDQTHRKVADTLFNIISGDSSEGITIGLEGGWGGGKSTIVSLLKKRIPSSKSKVHYFYFDAWAHEGDPLRRIFLEEMIDQLANQDNSDLLDLKEKIGRRKKESKTKTKKTVTKLGMWLALSSFFIPFGVAIVSGTASEVVMRFSPPYHSTFCVGMILSLAPLFVVGCNILKNMHAKKKIWDPRRWIFLHGESRVDEFHEISEEEERSSIEFEKFFKKIVKNILREEQNRLLIVIDNLDRISRDDSLRIWSTLQTFLQRRNPNNDKTSEFERIWILVPYDESGLRKLWDIKPNNEHSCSNSFFDKCFQLRLQAPRLLTSGWEVFCQKCMDSALLNWSNEEMERALSIFRWYRETISDSPSPREIKMFINQVGILRIHVNASVGIEAIACFVIEKYLKGASALEMEDDLISGSYPTQSLLSLFNSDNIRAEISAILFGVKPAKGQQLLLRPLIAKHLREVNSDELVNLCEIHEKAFWTIFDLFTRDIQNMPAASRCCLTVEQGLWKKYRKDCAPFISRLSSLERDVSVDSFSFPSFSQIDNYLSYVRLLIVEERSIKRFYSWLGEAFLRDCDSDKSDPTKYVQALHRFYEIGGELGSFNICGDSWSLEFWSKIAIASNAGNLNSHKYLIPPEKLSNEISEKLIYSTSDTSNIIELIRYAIRVGIKAWDSTIYPLETFCDRSKLNQTGVSFLNVLNVFHDLVGMSAEINTCLVRNVKSYQYWGAVGKNSKEELLFAILLLVRLMPERIDNLEIRRSKEANSVFRKAKSFLKEPNEDIAMLVWERVKLTADLGFLWILATDSKNMLVGSIIEIALIEGNTDFFILTDNVFDSYLNAFRLISDENREALAKSFVDSNNFENEIADIKSMALGDNSIAVKILLQEIESRKEGAK